MPTSAHRSGRFNRRWALLWLVSSLLIPAGLGWLILVRLDMPPELPAPTPEPLEALTPGQVARMDSLLFRFSPGWTVTPQGADPQEPPDPWSQPSGTVTFDYQGQELALKLAVGDYWAYLFVMVDDAPANRLPVIPGNRDSQGRLAGYKPLYEPERQGPSGPGTRWVRVHRAADPGPHRVRLEFWRGWGQAPLRAVGVDALPPPPPPTWPGVALLVLGAWGVLLMVRSLWQIRNWPTARRLETLLQEGPTSTALALGSGGLILAAGGAILGRWWLCDAGLALLGLAGLLRPSVWIAALLLGLPFYLAPLPILPDRGFNLVELGVWGGLAILALRGILLPRPPQGRKRRSWLPGLLLAGVMSWALISVGAAEHVGPALREWRTVFLAGAAFALLLQQTLLESGRSEDRWLILGGWLAGGSLVALVALGQAASGEGLIAAEGVRRVRALYGSPNNLALYLDRTALVTLGLALFTWNRWRWLWWGLAGVQLAALLLTFSKGALLLGLPAGFAVLWLGGLLLLRQAGRSRRPLWLLAGAVLATGLALLPFLDTERFQRLLDFRPGTTGSVRLLLWRSAWAMGLDHPLLGVGPDNFLYAYRSGYILPLAWWDPDLNHPHNLLLDWWTRLGIPGLVLGLAWMGAGVRGLWRDLQRRGWSALGVGLLAGTVAALAHGLIDASYALPDLMLVWVVMFGIGSKIEG